MTYTNEYTSALNPMLDMREIGGQESVKYYRHRRKRFHGDNGKTSDLGWLFTSINAEEVQKQINIETEAINEKYPTYQIQEWVYITHEISQDDYDIRSEFSEPIKQIIWSL